MDSDDSKAMEDLGTAKAEPISPEKKRNRKSDNKDANENTTKKKKKNTKKKQRIEATIQVFQDQPELAPPIVGYFPSGFEPGSGGPTGARVFRHASKPKRLQVVVTPSDSKVDFVGTNYSGEAEVGQQHCSYSLGVLDKETQTLKILPIASNKIFRLEPKVRGLPILEKEPDDLEGKESADSKFNQMKQLTKLYGTKRAKRETEKLENLRQEEDPETKKDINEKLKQLGVSAEEDPEGVQVSVDRNIPPYNTEATSPQEAYPLDKIILKGDSVFLEDIYRTLQEEAEGSWDDYPSFISNRIKKLREIKNDEERKRLAGILSYISHLIKFKDQHSMDGVTTAIRRKVPPILRQRFSSKFEDNAGSKKLSSQKIDLLISYVLVLTLYADEFQTNLTDIAKDLRVSSLTVRGYYEQLGCKLIRQSNLWYATLQVPLRFPELRQRRRR